VWTRRTPDEIREFWRFPGFEIQLFTGVDAMPAATSGIRAPRWFLFLRGEPGRACEGFPDPLPNETLNLTAQPASLLLSALATTASGIHDCR
jgi:hypothetical protein